MVIRSAGLASSFGLWCWSRRLRVCFAVACTATGASCHDMGPVATRDGSPVQTDSLVYTLRRESGAWRAYVMATYRNVDTGTVYFARCTSQDTLPIFYFRRTGPDSMRDLFTDQGWECSGGAATGALPPGGTVTVRGTLGSVDQPQMQPPLQLSWLVGLMRVQLELCRSYASASDDCDLLPQAARQSNAFEVRF